jgi:hypothetical protein
MKKRTGKKNQAGFKFVIDFGELSQPEYAALMKADISLAACGKINPGAILAQVYVYKGLQNVQVRGCFIEHEYASRIQEILAERKAKQKVRKKK